jgi:hypothetical protein
MALLQYDIKVVGADTVDKAFASIEARLRQHNRTVAQMTGLGPAAASRAARPGGAAAAVRAGNDNASQSAKRAIDRAAEMKVRAEKRVVDLETKERIRARNVLNQVGMREMKQEERAHLASIRRQEREKIASTKRETREQKKEAAKVVAESKERTKFAKETVGHGLGRAGGTVGAIGRTGAALLGVGGAGLAASAVAGATRLDEQTRRLVISGRQGGEKSKIDPNDLRKQFEHTGIETGMNAEDIAAGAQAFVTLTGNIDGAIKNHKIFAQVAQATGAAVEDVAQAAAAMSTNMDITAVDDMKTALATMVLQGKKGAFELRDMAVTFPKIAAAASSFGIKGVGGLTQLGGFLQLARTATGSGEQAAFATEASLRQLTAKSPEMQSGEAFEGRKVEIFKGGNAKKGLRDFNDILGDVMEASQGDMVKLQKVFGEEGIRAIRPLISTFREGSEKAGGGTTGAKAGRAAVMSQLKESATVQGGYGDVEQDASAAMKSFAVQMTVVQSQFKQAIADEVMPELMKLGPELAKLVPYVGRAVKVFVDLVEYFMNNPFKSLAMVVAAQLAADFAKARISSVVTGFVEKIFQKIRLPSGGGGIGIGGGGGGTAPAGASTGGFFNMRPSQQSGMGALGSAMTGAAIGFTIGTAILTAGVVNFERGEAEMKQSGQTLNKIRDMTSAEDLPKAREMVEEQRKKVAEVQKGGMVAQFLGRGVAEAVGVERPEELKTQQAFLEEMETRLKSLDQLKVWSDQIMASSKSQEEAAARLKAAAEKLGLAQPNRTNNPSPAKT